MATSVFGIFGTIFPAGHRFPFSKSSANLPGVNFQLSSALLLLCAFAGFAHEPGLSTLKLQQRGGQLRATLIYSPRDLQAVIALDKNSDGTISTEEIEARRPTLDTVARELLLATLDGKPLSILETKCSLDENNNFEFESRFAPESGSALTVTSRWIEVLPPGHRQFVTFQEGTGPDFTEDLLDAVNNVFTVTLSPTAAPPTQSTSPPPQKRRSFSNFFVLGIEHILTGYDHLLFLFALLIVCDNFKSIAKIVTCFTLAHSLTLALATLDIVQISPDVVEPMIAASIVYVGLENILRSGHPKGRWLLTFGFGLVHGFGFAGVLREMQIAKAGSVVVPLVSFNLGVEAGQIAVAALVLPLIWWLKKKPAFAPRWVPACSALVAVVGTYWFIQRVWF